MSIKTTERTESGSRGLFFSRDHFQAVQRLELKDPHLESAFQTNVKFKIHILSMDDSRAAGARFKEARKKAEATLHASEDDESLALYKKLYEAEHATNEELLKQMAYLRTRIEDLEDRVQDLDTKRKVAKKQLKPAAPVPPHDK